jgi:hypothetical protein
MIVDDDSNESIFITNNSGNSKPKSKKLKSFVYRINANPRIIQKNLKINDMIDILSKREVMYYIYTYRGKNSI